MTSPAANDPGSQARDPAAAFARIERELDRVVETRRVSVDIPHAVNAILVTLPKLRALEPTIAEELPKFPRELLHKLEDYALGCLEAHFLALPESKRPSPVRPLLEQALPLRRKLLIVAEALAKAGLVDQARVAQIRAGRGHLDVATGLLLLVELFRAEWAALRGRIWITEHDVERAGELGADLLTWLNARVPKTAEERRMKAYTLMVEAYDECRAAVAYLRRHEGDVDAFAPSLFVRAGRRRKTTATSSTSSAAPSAAPIAAEPALRDAGHDRGAGVVHADPTAAEPLGRSSDEDVLRIGEELVVRDRAHAATGPPAHATRQHSGVAYAIEVAGRQ